MAQSFKVGDTVQLKSGGPMMTVTEIDDSLGIIFCVWFPDNKKEERGNFPADALEIV